MVSSLPLHIQGQKLVLTELEKTGSPEGREICHSETPNKPLPST